MTVHEEGLASAAARPRILFVEDEAVLREHLAQVLSADYYVDTAGSGTEALRAVMNAKPDLIVTDIVMPEMDGVELLKTLRAQPNTQHIPVLLISGLAPEAQRIEGFQEGADGYLAKPYSERELRALVGSMLQAAQQRREAARRETLEQAERTAMAERAVLLESITDAFYALDRQLRFIYVNQRALDYYGKTCEELLGRSIWQVFAVLRGTLIQDHYERALHMQSSASFEMHSPLTGRWIDIRVYPTGQGLAVYFHDVSDRKHAEQELQTALAKLQGHEWRLALATRVAGFGVFTWDKKTDRISFENKPAHQISRIVKEAPLTGLHFVVDLLHPADRCILLRRLVRSMRSAQSLRVICRIRTAEGTWRSIQIDGGCERAGNDSVERLVGVVQDVTEREETEASLRESDRRKDEFLALLAHELRNPLAPIANGLQILRLRAPADPVSERTLGLMDRQVRHLVRLVGDLLDISRITHGKLQLRPQKIQLTDVVASAVEASRMLVEAHGHEFQIEVRARDLVVVADADRLVQVFANLINNSAKYTNAGGRIHLAVGREDGYAVIAVRDNGIGIAPEALPQLFEMFSQIQTQRPHPEGGLGIGLALVRAIVEMHRGTIEVASAGLGMGSTFTVRLPLAGSTIDPSSARASAPAPHTVNGRSVLIVDDNADAAASLEMLLQLKGCQVYTASSGEEAIEKARGFRPQIIFMDIGLPGMDGVEAARRIHALPEANGTEIIALTGWGQPADRDRTRRAGMKIHLVKPVTPEALDEALATASVDLSE